MKKLVRRAGGVVVDYPMVVTVVLVAVVVAHAIVALRCPTVDLPARLLDTTVSDPKSTLSSLALGVAGVSAVVGGFAGVVVVFGLGTESDRFRLLRSRGGRRLRASWVSVVLSSLGGAFGSVAAAVAIVGFDARLGLWFLELCLLCTAHGAIRLTALLAGLAGIVDQQDRDHQQQQRTASTKSLIPVKRGTDRCSAQGEGSTEQ